MAGVLGQIGQMAGQLGVPGFSQKVYPTHWQEEWTACDKDPQTCLIATCCPCVQFAMNYVVTKHVKPTGPAALLQPPMPPEAIVAQQRNLACGVCCIYGVLLYFGPLTMGLAGLMNRGEIRRKHGITTGDCATQVTDCCFSAFCHCFALSQEWRELQFRQDQPPIDPMLVVPQQQQQMQR